MDFTNHPFLNVIWSMFLIFIWIAWIWLLIMILGDLFRRKDTSGFVKAIWVIVLIFVPFLGVLIYLIANGNGMAERNMEAAKAQQEQMDAYIRDRAGSGGSAAEIERAKSLLDSGAISQAEFDKLKAQALA
jgi:hypothetical protein